MGLFYFYLTLILLRLFQQHYCYNVTGQSQESEGSCKPARINEVHSKLHSLQASLCKFTATHLTLIYVCTCIRLSVPLGCLKMKFDDVHPNDISLCSSGNMQRNELDSTVIKCPATESSIDSPIVSLNACIEFLPSEKLDDELIRLGCSLSGSEGLKRKRLVTKISCEISANASQQTLLESDELKTHLTGMERVLVKTVKQLEILTGEIVKMKEDMTTNNKSPSTIGSKMESRANLALTNALNGHRDAPDSIKEQTNELRNEVIASRTQALEIEETVQRTKLELNNWHNSAFFKDDSRLIKDIHDCIANGNIATTGELADHRTVNTPISEEIARARASTSNNSSPPALVHVSSLSHSPRPGQHSTTPPQADPIDTSRRPTFLNMTSGVTRIQHEEPNLPPPSSQRINSASQRSQQSSSNHSQLRTNQRRSNGSRIAVDTHSSSQRINSTFQRTNSSYQRTNSTSQPSLTQQPSLRRQERRAPRRQSVGWFSGSAPSTRKNFITVLITDSMMRHIPEDALGTNHELHILNKTDSAGLLEARVRESLNVLKPDFIYVHLGINDFMQKKSSSEITANYAEFSLRISDDLPRSRVIFSLPTPTDRYNESQVIGVLHKSTTDWIRNTEGHKETEERRVHFNSNSNFRSDDWNQKKELFARDGVHLTPPGKDQMTRNFRFAIHSITRKIKQQQRGVTR